MARAAYLLTPYRRDMPEAHYARHLKVLLRTGASACATRWIRPDMTLRRYVGRRR